MARQWGVRSIDGHRVDHAEFDYRRVYHRGARLDEHGKVVPGVRAVVFPIGMPGGPG